MQLALGRVQVQLQVTLAPTPPYTHTTIRAARERAERQLAAHSATVERAYRRERSRRAIEADRARWTCNQLPLIGRV